MPLLLPSVEHRQNIRTRTRARADAHASCLALRVPPSGPSPPPLPLPPGPGARHRLHVFGGQGAAVDCLTKPTGGFTAARSQLPCPLQPPAAPVAQGTRALAGENTWLDGTAIRNQHAALYPPGQLRNVQHLPGRPIFQGNGSSWLVGRIAPAAMVHKIGQKLPSNRPMNVPARARGPGAAGLTRMTSPGRPCHNGRASTARHPSHMVGLSQRMRPLTCAASGRPPAVSGG